MYAYGAHDGYCLIHSLQQTTIVKFNHARFQRKSWIATIISDMDESDATSTSEIAQTVAPNHTNDIEAAC